MSNTAASVLEVAAGEIGYSRWDDPLPGTKYGRFYADLVGDPAFGASGVPFCAMFVTWVFCQAEAQACTCCRRKPRAYCPWIVEDGEAAGKVVSKYDAEPGDIILFEWDGDWSADHVGLVAANHGGYVETIEGNTDGGRVARKTRSWDVVCCVIRPDFDGSQPEPEPVPDKLVVDGEFGRQSCLKLMGVLGCPDHLRDGVISGQYYPNKRYFPNVHCFEFDGGSGDSWTMKALQRRVGCDDDGVAGWTTAGRIQQHLKDRGYDPGEVDHYVGPRTVRAWQQALNDGKF